MSTVTAQMLEATILICAMVTAVLLTIAFVPVV